MAEHSISSRGPFTPIAPKTVVDTTSLPAFAPTACQYCTVRKIRCSKHIPRCSACSRKGSTSCVYPQKLPRGRKRKLAEFQHTSGLTAQLPSAQQERTTYENRKPVELHAAEVLISLTETGKLIAGNGRSRYLDSPLWRKYGEVTSNDLSDAEDDNHTSEVAGLSRSADQKVPDDCDVPALDPVTATLLNEIQPLSNCRPSKQDLTYLWNTYTTNVAPLCKVLHIPSTQNLIDAWNDHPDNISPSQACLKFAICHFAVHAMLPEDCFARFGASHEKTLHLYRNLFLRTLANANWLASTEMIVMQALVLYLIAIRHKTNPGIYWMLTGIAVRMAQRMGLHKDGSGSELSPFEVEMRRRLFWQLLPLDGFASQISGTGITIPLGSWDTMPPSNNNDDAIAPGMIEPPVEQKGATEMIFVLMRAELSNLFVRTGVKPNRVGSSVQLRDSAELDDIVDATEAVIEDKFIRYCDIVEPLHEHTVITARSALNTVRLHRHMPSLLDQTIADEKRRYVCDLAQKILDTNNAAFVRPNLARFRWQTRGQLVWDAILCILGCIIHPNFLSRSEADIMWERIQITYSNRPTILSAQGPLRVIMGRLTMKAWDVNPPTTFNGQEPEFITFLRTRSAQGTAKPKRNVDVSSDTIREEGSNPRTGMPGEASLANDDQGLLHQVLDEDLALTFDLEFGETDWLLWDALVQADQVTT